MTRKYAADFEAMLLLAAIMMVLGVAVFVAAPFAWRTRRENESDSADRISQLEHERTLALQGLRDLEFDREMRKLSEGDSAVLKDTLDRHAMAAMREIERLQAGRSGTARGYQADPTTINGQTVVARSDRIRFCPECGQPRVSNGKFCARCGTLLPPAAPGAARSIANAGN